MVIYLAKKYYVNSVVFFFGFIIFPYLSFGDLPYLFPRAVFLGSLAGSVYTWYDFRERNIWPLFDNLRHSKFLLLGLMFLSLQLIPLIVKFFL